MTSAVNPEQFASLVELQDRHAALVKEVGRDLSSAPTQVNIRGFVQSCMAAGHVLEAAADRAAAQSLITFWTNRLERAARETASVDRALGASTYDAQDDLQTHSPNNFDFNSEDVLLAEFLQDAFDELVIAPAEKWIGQLSEVDTTLVRRIVLRLLNLRKDGHFETVPNTRVLLESLDPTERASELLSELVRLGVVRRLRHSLEFEEYSLQSLDRLRHWHSLQTWMDERREFRIKAEESLDETFLQHVRIKHQPLKRRLREARIAMTRAGSWLQSMLMRIPGVPRLFEPEVVSISDKEIEEAESYRDKNSVEVKYIYLKRQLDKHRLETSQERLFGISVVTLLLLFLASWAWSQWQLAEKKKREAEIAGRAAEIARSEAEIAGRAAVQTRQMYSLQLADQRFSQGVSNLIADPSASMLKAAESLAEFDQSKELLDPQLADRWRESYLWSLGATKIQTPVLAGIAFREQTLNSDSQQQSKAIETTVLAEDGQRCLMASIVNGKIVYQFSQRNDEKSPGYWQRDPEHTLDWPANLPLASDVRLQAFLSRNGSVAVITVTSPLVKNTHLFTYQASEGKFQSRGTYPEVSSATLNPEGDCFGVAHKSPTSTKANQADVSSQLTVWETRSWLKKLELKRVDGTISALAFSPKQNVASTSNRGPVSQASTQVAAAIVGPDSKLSVVQWSVENGPRSGSKENFVKDFAPTDEPVGVVLMSPKTTTSESAVIISYCQNRTPALFISQGMEGWVIRTDMKKSDSQEFASYPVAQSRPITAAAFSPDGTMLTTGSRDGKLALWFLNAASPQPVSLELSGHSWHSEQVFGVTFSPDSKYLISGSRDKRMLVYDIHARYIVAAPILHSNTINQVAVTPDGRFAATMAKNVVYNWHMPQIGKLPLSLGVLSGRTIDADIVTTGNMLAAGGKRTEAALERGWVRVWDLERVLTKPEIPLPKPVVHLSIHATGKWLCAIDRQGHRHMVDDTGKRLWFESKIEGEGLESGIGRFSQFAPDDKFIKLLIASPSSSPTNDDQTVLRVLEWNASNLSTPSSPFKVAIHQTIRGTIAGAQFAPDSSRFVAHTTQGGVFVGDLKTEKMVELTGDGLAESSGKNQAHREKVTLAAFSLDGLRVVSGSEDDHAFIWSLDDGQWRVFPLEVRETDTIAPNTANINYVAFSATGQKVVTASADGRGIVWKLNQQQLRYEPHFSIKVLGTNQGMVQAEFIDSRPAGLNAVDSQRYLFCRWGDDTIRVFDTLIVNNPLKTDEPLFNGREVASLAAPYHIRKARLNLTADGSWQITAIGHESSGEPGALGSQGICELSDTLGWSSQLKISNWLLRPLESSLAEPESSKRLKSIASVISARRLVGALQPMENLPAQRVLSEWKSVANPHLLFEQPDVDQIVAWHLDEADSSLLARPPQPTAALWHWRQVQSLKPEKLTDNVQLRRVAALAMTGHWDEAEDLLGNTSGQLASDVDFLSLRAALRLKQACVPKIDPLRKKLLEDQAIGDYQTILTRVPEDQAVRGRLATLFLRTGADADAFRELDILVESAGATVEPELLQSRTSVRTRLGHDSRDIYRDFKRTANLFFAQNKLDDAVGQLRGALAMAETKNGTLQPGIPTQEVAELYEMLADVHRQRKAEKQTQPNENGRQATLAFLQAIKYAPDNTQLLHKFLFGVSDSDLPKGPAAWIEIDDLFKRAMRLDPDNEALAIQRIATLIPQRDDDHQLDARLLQATSVYQHLAEKGWMNEERHLQMAALQVQSGDLPAAERSLLEAWEKLPDSTLIGLRLSLTQLAQHKPQEYKQTLNKLVQRSSSTAEGSDASNIAWAAAYAPDTLADHPSVVQLARQAATASPDDPVAQSVLGAVLLRSGDKSAAVEQLSSATLKRDSLTIQQLSAQQKLGGDAMDSLLTAMAQRDPQADEAFSLAKREIEKYSQQWPATEHFFDWIWNKLEFQVLEEEAQQLLER